MERLKIIFICLMASALLYSCEKSREGAPQNNNVIEEQNAVLFYFSGNWCGPCGKYGRPALKNIQDEFQGRVAIIGCQVNGGLKDPLNNVYANAMSGVFGVQAVPTSYVGANGTIKTVPGNVDMESDLRNVLNNNLNSNPIVNSHLTTQIEGDEMFVNVKVKFFEEAQSDYELGLYLLESKILGRQNVTGAGWEEGSEFNNVLRKTITDMSNQIGEKITSSAAEGEEFAMPYAFLLSPEWNKEHLSVASVIWRKNSNGTYTIVNGSLIAVNE